MCVVGVPFSVFGLLFVAFAIFVGYQSVTRSAEFTAAKARYERRRAAEAGKMDSDTGPA
jgi:hypothetical protein